MHAVVVCNLHFFMLLLKLLYIICFQYFLLYHEKYTTRYHSILHRCYLILFAFILFFCILTISNIFLGSCRQYHIETGVFSTCLQHVCTNQLKQNLGKIQMYLQVLMKILTQNHKLFYKYNILFLHFAPNGLCSTVLIA